MLECAKFLYEFLKIWVRVNGLLTSKRIGKKVGTIRNYYDSGLDLDRGKLKKMKSIDFRFLRILSLN